MSLNRQEFTNAGISILGRANNGEQLTISKVVIGAGRAATSDELWPLTELLDYKMDAVITQKIDQGNGILLIDSAFNSSQAPEPFDLAEVGILARINGEPEQLYSVGNVLASGADHVDPAVESIHAFKIKVVIDRATDVTVVIGESRDILAENIGSETAGPGWFKEKIANTLRFKRVVEGEGIELLDTADTIKISQRIIDVDLDLYVPFTHPQGTPGTRFQTIEDALDFLRTVLIRPDREARINVDRGNFNYTESIKIRQSNGLNISIIGAPLVPLTFVSCQAATGAQGNWTIRITVDDASAARIGDFVSITFARNAAIGTTPGNTAYAYEGIWQITDIIENQLLIRCTDNSPTALTSTGLLTAATVRLYQTVLRFNNSNGFEIFSPGIGYLRNLAVVGDRTSLSLGLIAGSVSDFSRVDEGDYNIIEQRDPALIHVDDCGFTDFRPCEIEIGLGSQLIATSFLLITGARNMGLLVRDGAIFSALDRLVINGNGQINIATFFANVVANADVIICGVTNWGLACTGGDINFPKACYFHRCGGPPIPYGPIGVEMNGAVFIPYCARAGYSNGNAAGDWYHTTYGGEFYVFANIVPTETGFDVEPIVPRPPGLR